jgi:predicted Zn-dependent protease
MRGGFDRHQESRKQGGHERRERPASRYHSIVKTFPECLLKSLSLLSAACRALVVVAVIACLVRPNQLAYAAPNLNDDSRLPSLGDSERESLSPLTERKLGEHIMREIRHNPDYLDDAPTLEYLNDFGNQLLAARPEARGEAGYDFFFFAVRDPMLNAFALPGGFIAVHSALLLAAQTESELASVVAHEIGHVAQRHIARMLGQQKQDMLIPLAGAILAVLAARSNSDASAALLVGSQGVVLQRQLNFSRDAEREADRIGLQILRDAGFETAGMVTFFGRMQNASSGYSDFLPAYLRSHPLTTERIADIEARIRDLRYRQHADNVDFQLIRARMRVLQDDTSQGWRDASEIFAAQLLQKTRTQTVAGKYGLALVALRRNEPVKALLLLQEARIALGTGAPRNGGNSSVLDYLGIDLLLASGKYAEAVSLADAARSRFPLSRGLARRYADVLLAAGRTNEAVEYLRDQAQLYREDPHLQKQLAKAYSVQGKRVLQHLALAESYALNGSLQAAMDQLRIARTAPDATFYDQALVDARERDLEARWKEELANSKREK